jgi:LPXTG-motif cell wall-anchored protein
MTGISEDNAFYFALGMAAGAALLWMLVRTIRMKP